VHATAFADKILEAGFADIIVRGEGENTFVKLIESLCKGDSLRNIKGISFKDKIGVVHNDDDGIVDLDSIAEIPYGLVDVKDYFCRTMCSENELTIITSRGCPILCKFCYSKKFYNGGWRGMSAGKVISIFKRILSLGAESVAIMDDNFFASEKRVDEICDLIKKEGIRIKIRTTCTCNYLLEASLERLKMLRECGFVYLCIGVESVSSNINKEYFKNKSVAYKNVIDINAKLKMAGITPKYIFMGGLPGESFGDFRESARLILELDRVNKKQNYFTYNIFMPLPDTELYDIAIDKGFKPPASLCGWGKYFSLLHRLPWVNRMNWFFMKGCKSFVDNYLELDKRIDCGNGFLQFLCFLRYKLDRFIYERAIFR
jgi:radical SAM superfamily enzyme YgiQ (UPF0313 family)